MAEQTIVCSQACTVTVQHEFALPVLDLSIGDAASISSAVLLVWAAGYGFRLAIRALNVDSDSSTSTDKD